MFSRECNLKYYSRNNEYKNSTNSCSFHPDTNTGYSYAEQIIKVIKGPKKTRIKLFNNYSFSNTTSKHQYYLSGFYSDIEADQGFIVDVYSLNNISNIKDLKKELLDHLDAENLNVMRELFTDKQFEKIKKDLDKQEKKTKRIAKFDRINKKLCTLDYSTKNIVAKFREYKKERPNGRIWFTHTLNYSQDLYKVDLIREFLDGHKFEYKGDYRPINLELFKKLYDSGHIDFRSLDDLSVSRLPELVYEVKARIFCSDESFKNQDNFIEIYYSDTATIEHYEAYLELEKLGMTFELSEETREAFNEFEKMKVQAPLFCA